MKYKRSFKLRSHSSSKCENKSDKESQTQNLKGTVNVISSDPSGKDGNAIKCLNFCKLFIFNCGFFTKVTCAFLLQENTLELSEINTLKPQKSKNIYSIDILIR